MLILLSKNKAIIKEYLKPNTNIGFIATASELESMLVPYLKDFIHLCTEKNVTITKNTIIYLYYLCCISYK